MANDSAGLAGAYDSRDVQASGDDGCVGGFAANICDESCEHAAFELQHIGWRDVVCDQNQWVFLADLGLNGVELRAGRLGGQGPHERFNDLFEIGLALSEVLVLHFVKLARKNLELGGQGPFGVVVAFDDPLHGGASEGLVAQEHEVNIQDGGQLGRGIAWQLGLEYGELFNHGIASVSQALDFLFGGRGVNKVVGNIQMTGCNEHRLADRYAAGDWESEYLYRHWGMLARSGLERYGTFEDLAKIANHVMRTSQQCHEIVTNGGQDGTIVLSEPSMRDLPLPTYPLADVATPASPRRSLHQGSESVAPRMDARHLEVVWARHEDEVRQAQQLRYQVFAGEMGARLPAHADFPGHDIDLFDPFCEHLLVRVRTGVDEDPLVVGTYRVLPPSAASRVGGLYTETEFDLTRLRPLRNKMVELGRLMHPSQCCAWFQ